MGILRSFVKTIQTELTKERMAVGKFRSVHFHFLGAAIRSRWSAVVKMMMATTMMTKRKCKMITLISSR